MDTALIDPSECGRAQVMLFNPTGVSCSVEDGCVLGEAEVATVIQAPESAEQPVPSADVRQVGTESNVEQRKAKLTELIVCRAL